MKAACRRDKIFATKYLMRNVRTAFVKTVHVNEGRTAGRTFGAGGTVSERQGAGGFKRKCREDINFYKRWLTDDRRKVRF